jgi:hypothetical protein
MLDPSPEPRENTEGIRPDRVPHAPRPRWVTAVIVGAVMLLVIVVVLHLTGNSLGGPGSHVP